MKMAISEPAEALEYLSQALVEHPRSGLHAHGVDCH